MLYVLLMGLVRGQGEQRSVQEGSCPAMGLRGGHCASHLWGPWHCAVGCMVLCVQREWETCTAPWGRSSLSRGGQGKGSSPCSHTLVCSCTSPWHCWPRPPCLCPAARHRLISPGACSCCADALVPAPNSQPPALAAAFLEQLREGRSSQDCLTRRVNVTLPLALLRAGAWLWVHRR